MAKLLNMKKQQDQQPQSAKKLPPIIRRTIFGMILVGIGIFFLTNEVLPLPPTTGQSATKAYHPKKLWLQRAYDVTNLFQKVYTPGWQGAYGSIGDAYLFATTNDSSLFRFHMEQQSVLNFYNGYWVDDRAWACIAELKWWEVTGRKDSALVNDAANRYIEARNQGRLSNFEGFWTWYNWPPNANVNDKIFTNSNMNQMVTVACMLYKATKDRLFLDDALLVWNGDKNYPGVEKMLYKGNGKWDGRQGSAAFGKELPWGGTEYCAIGAALYRATKDEKYKRIVVATAKHMLDPATGWVDSVDFYQLHMDGNGAFVNFLLDAYMIAPKELADVPAKIEKMLEHVWTNNHGHATVELHRTSDDGIRNGWNPNGGEDGYGVGEIGTVHAQGEAARAFGVFAYVRYVLQKKAK